MTRLAWWCAGACLCVGGAARAEEPPTPVDDAAVARALSRHRHEAPVSEVVAAALAAHGDTPARLRAMARRARRSGLLPTLSLRARRGQGVDLSAVAGTSNSLRTSTGDDLMLEATLSFDLSLLIHAPAEVTIARAEQDAQDARRELLREVVALYFERRRIQLQRALGPGDRIALLARQREIEALLDAFTNGAFRRMINGSVNRPDGKPKTAQTP